MVKRRKAKVITIGLLTLALAVSMCGCGGDKSASTSSDDQIVIRLAHVEAESSLLHQSAEKFEQYVEEETDGKVDVQLYANSELGDEVALLDSVKMGNLD